MHRTRLPRHTNESKAEHRTSNTRHAEYSDYAIEPRTNQNRSSANRSALGGARNFGLVDLLRQGPWPVDALQLIGDGLAGALVRRVGAADDLARECVAGLRDRGWEGDEELADALDARLGGPAPLLRPLPVDLDQLAGVLEGDPVEGGGRIDLHTGEVWPQPAIDYLGEVDETAEDEDDPQRWLWVDSEGSRAGYRDMQRFIATVEDPGAADRLSIAIEGHGAFRRFKDLLQRWPELQEQWHAFSEDRHRGRARAWLADQGYLAAPPREQPER